MADVLAFPTRERRFDAALAAYRLVGLMREAVDQVSDELCATYEEEFETTMRRDFAQRWSAHCEAQPSEGAIYADRALVAELSDEIWALVSEVLERRLAEIDRAEASDAPAN